jgi:hypothetical protein
MKRGIPSKGNPESSVFGILGKYIGANDGNYYLKNRDDSKNIGWDLVGENRATPPPSSTANPTPTPTYTPTVTPTCTLTPTYTPTTTNTPTISVTPTKTSTQTPTVTPSIDWSV